MTKYDGNVCARCRGRNWLHNGRCGDCPCLKCGSVDFYGRGLCLGCYDIKEKMEADRMQRFRQEKQDEQTSLASLRQEKQNKQDALETKLNDFYFIKTSHICAVWSSPGEPAKMMMANGATFDISLGAAGELTEMLKNKNSEYFEYINQDVECIRELVKRDGED